MLQRRRDGVRPDMPTAAERQELLTAIGGKPYWESTGSHENTVKTRGICTFTTGPSILVMLLHCIRWMHSVNQMVDFNLPTLWSVQLVYRTSFMSLSLIIKRKMRIGSMSAFYLMSDFLHLFFCFCGSHVL